MKHQDFKLEFLKSRKHHSHTRLSQHSPVLPSSKPTRPATPVFRSAPVFHRVSVSTSRANNPTSFKSFARFPCTRTAALRTRPVFRLNQLQLFNQLYWLPGTRSQPVSRTFKLCSPSLSGEAPPHPVTLRPPSESRSGTPRRAPPACSFGEGDSLPRGETKDRPQPPPSPGATAPTPPANGARSSPAPPGTPRERLGRGGGGGRAAHRQPPPAPRARPASTSPPPPAPAPTSPGLARRQAGQQRAVTSAETQRRPSRPPLGPPRAPIASAPPARPPYRPPPPREIPGAPAPPAAFRGSQQTPHVTRTSARRSFSPSNGHSLLPEGERRLRRLTGRRRAGGRADYKSRHASGRTTNPGMLSPSGRPAPWLRAQAEAWLRPAGVAAATAAAAQGGGEA